MVSGRARAVSMVLVATVLWGFIGVPVRVLSDAGLDSLQINGARTLITTLMLAAVLYFYDRSLFRIRGKDVWILILAAVMKLLMDICYVQAQVMLSLSLAAVLLNTGCYFTLILSFFLYRSGLTPMRVLAVFIGFFGCSLMMGVFTEDLGELDSAGLMIGLGSGLSGAVYMISLKRGMDSGIHPTSALFYVFLFGSFMILPLMDPIGTAVTVSSGWDVAGTLLILGFAFTLVAYYCYSIGLKRLEPSTVNVLLFMEVAMAAVAGMLVYGEMLSPADVLGLAMILTSVFMVEKGRPGEEDDAVR